MDGVTDINLRFCLRSHRDVATVLAEEPKAKQLFPEDFMSGQVIANVVADRKIALLVNGLRYGSN